MAAVTSQPTPFGFLRREKHIESLFSILKEKQRQTQDPEDDDNTCLTEGKGLDLMKPNFPLNVSRLKKSPQGEGDISGVTEQGSFGLEPSCAQRGEMQPSSCAVWVKGADGAVADGTRWHSNAGGGTGSSNQGLQVLMSTNQLCVAARLESHGFTCDPGRSYDIKTESDKQLLVVVEDTSCLCLHLCGPARSCCIRLYDQNDQEVLRFIRPFRVDACCLGCCLMEIQAFTVNNELIGMVKQRWSMFNPVLEVCDADGTSFMKIQGSCCPLRCSADHQLQVTSKLGSHLAVIWKRWRGFNAEYNMDHEYFGVDVLANISPRARALLLAAAFLLNYMFFEMS